MGRSAHRSDKNFEDEFRARLTKALPDGWNMVIKDLTGIAPPTIYRWQKQAPRVLSDLITLARFCNVDVVDLTFGSKESEDVVHLKRVFEKLPPKSRELLIEIAERLTALTPSQPEPQLALQSREPRLKSPSQPSVLPIGERHGSADPKKPLDFGEEISRKPDEPESGNKGGDKA